MASCKINLEHVDNDLIGRVCSISLANKKAKGFQVAKRGKATRIETEQFTKSTASQNITEYYVPMSLEDLREIDSDAQKQHAFIVSRMPKLKTSTTINAVIMRLMLDRNEEITPKDVEYLWDLLNISGNDIIVPPFLSFPGAFDPETYMTFVKDFISYDEPSSGELASAIPAQVPHSGIGSILELYEGKKVNTYIMDFSGKKPFNPDSEIQLSKLLRDIPAINDEKWFLYAFDVKPFKKGPEELVAEDLLLSASGFNAVGPRHTVPRKSKEFIGKLGAIDPLISNKVFSPMDYGYHMLKEPSILKGFEKWMPTVSALDAPLNLKGPLTSNQQNKLRVLAKAYSHSLQFPEIGTVTEQVKDQHLRDHLESKVLPQDTIRHIDKIKKKIKKKA